MPNKNLTNEGITNNISKIIPVQADLFFKGAMKTVHHLLAAAALITVFALLHVSCTSPSKRAIGFSDMENSAGVETNIFHQKYTQSVLISVGIDSYQHEDRLRYAVSDAQGVATLFQSLGFRTVELFNSDATKQNIMQLVQSEFQNAGSNDRIVFFFAGHGIDLITPDGVTKGYLAPVNGSIKQPKTLLPLDWFQIDLLADKKAGAKHILFILDACSSGIIATRSLVQVDDSLNNYIAELMKRRVRQVITAGTADQPVLDGGYKGHSIFTGLIIQGIEQNWADMNKDLHITAAELGLYLSQEVFNQSNGLQKPDFAKLIGTEGGDVVLKFPSSEELSMLRSGSKSDLPQNGSLLLQVTPRNCVVSIFDMDDNLIFAEVVHDGFLSIPDLPPADYQILVRAEDGNHDAVKILTGVYENVKKRVELPKKIHRLMIPTTL